jgi:hypothetical protein
MLWMRLLRGQDSPKIQLALFWAFGAPSVCATSPLAETDCPPPASTELGNHHTRARSPGCCECPSVVLEQKVSVRVSPGEAEKEIVELTGSLGSSQPGAAERPKCL